jgi:hypothetical protein
VPPTPFEVPMPLEDDVVRNVGHLRGLSPHGGSRNG